MQKTVTIDNASILASFGLKTAAFCLDDGSQLSVMQVVRHVPSRRCVCRASWQGLPVYVKLFFGEKAAQYASRDVKGVAALQAANILTPKILHQGENKQQNIVAVVFESIVDSTNAEEVWLGASEAERLKLAKQVVKTVAEHHKADLLQTDLYLKNFLIKDDAIFTIDGDGIRHFKHLSRQKALSNLSQLLSKFDVIMLDQQLPQLLQVYAQERAWKAVPCVANIQANVGAARRKAATSYADKKVFRQCTDVNVVKSKQLFTAVNSDYAKLDLPQTPALLDAFLSAKSMLKNGNTCTVCLAVIDNVRLVIKRYNIKNLWHGISRAFRPTRAAVSWANAHRLQLLGIATAKPVALIETRRFGLRGRAYFLTEYVDAPDMLVFFKKTIDGAMRAKAVKELVQLFYQLYLLNISHGDMKATNIKVLSDGRSLLIDLDSMKQHRHTFIAHQAHVRDLKRFMQNWKDEPSLYNAFVKVFKVVYVDHAPLQAAHILE
jgi:tRNA A-37 threonylcarbamoyl transferase component Bud32